MKRIFTLLFSLFFTTVAFSQFPTIYASLGSGDWNVSATWETFTGNASGTPGAPGTGTPAASTPSGTHHVYVRSGHTISMVGANRSCHSVTVESGGKLWANSSTASRLQVATGGTGFTYPQTGVIKNDGTIGGPGDGILFENTTASRVLNITGAGTYQIGRMRFVGGATAFDVTVDANMTLHVTGNYVISIAYNPNSNDNYTFTLNSGKTITATGATAYIHALSSSSQTVPGNGNYTYNIDGTLDFSGSTGMSYITPSSIAGKTTTINVGSSGVFKLGGGFDATPGATSVGSVVLNVSPGGVVDATSTTTLNTGMNYFRVAPTSVFRRTVAATDVLFPIGTSATNYNPVIINNAGTSDVFSVSVGNTVTNTGTMVDATKIVNKQWTITEAVAGGSDATVSLGWVAADQAAGFDPNQPLVIGRWNGTAWQYLPATRTGSGTLADPYVATSTSGFTSDFTSTNAFIVANSAALPVTFTTIKAFPQHKGVQIEWNVAGESNVANYVIERAINGRDFSAIATTEAKGITNYNAFDGAPVGGINYYRIKAVDKDGSIKTSGVLTVNISKSNAEVVVAPNPVRGSQLNMQISGLSRGTYNVTLYNDLGQVVYTGRVAAETTSLTQSIILPSGVKAGVYNLVFTGGDVKLNKRVVVE